MKKQQSGFTLIELIAVIVILGILAATAVPRFIDLQDAARQAAIEGMVGQMESASALNHAANVARDAGLDNTLVIADTADVTCAVAVNAVLEGSIDTTKYTITGAANTSATEGTVNTCTITDANDGTFSETFSIISAQ